MRRREFEDLVEKALQEIPEQFLDKIGDLAILVEDWPERELLLELGMNPDEETLFGLFSPGMPIFNATSDWDALPSRIQIFRGPIEEVCDTDAEIAEEVRLTVLHEIGHYFGLTEEQVEHL